MRDVCNNAEEQGIRCAFVLLYYEDNAHTLVAFETTDKGIVYFEPQKDIEMKPVIDKIYSECIVYPPEPPEPPFGNSKTEEFLREIAKREREFYSFYSL